jgi:hypothetical protein
MTYPDSPQIVTGTRTMLIALVTLEQSTRAGRLPDVAPGSPFWARTDQAVGLVAGGLAAYAPAGTQLRPEPPGTVSSTPGLGAATSNCSH